MSLPTSRYFDISTTGATVETLRRHSDLMDKKIASIMDRTKVAEDEWHQPPENATVLVLLIGIIAPCAQRNEKATITVHRNSWIRLTTSGPGVTSRDNLGALSRAI
ncbi:hypothetical protein JKG47_18040 [Acidithiobacillus sp. MC6.1]|nr:hypothetical protein [Acidithiobacillus sp. MC6.1]